MKHISSNIAKLALALNLVRLLTFHNDQSILAYICINVLNNVWNFIDQISSHLTVCGTIFFEPPADHYLVIVHAQHKTIILSRLHKIVGS